MEANATRAAKIAGLKLAQATEDSDRLPRNAPTLGEFARDFLKWVDEARREENTKIYYRDGWRLLCRMRLAGMRLGKPKDFSFFVTADQCRQRPSPIPRAPSGNCFRYRNKIGIDVAMEGLVEAVVADARETRNLRAPARADKTLNYTTNDNRKDIVE